MPAYTCTTTESTLNTDVKAALAREIAGIHSAITLVPSADVNVVFHDLPVENVYTDGVPATPVLVTGWVRAGHLDSDTTRLAIQVAEAVTWITGIIADRVLVVIQSSPARFAVDGGRVLPEPGDEPSWLGSE